MLPGGRRALAILLGVLAATACTGGSTITPPPPPPPPPSDTVSALGSWTLVLNRPIATKYEGMSFPDAMHGWVISDQGDIVSTADGGATWSEQASGLGHLRSLDFVNASLGFAGTLAGVLYRTTDGGAHWVDITSTLPKPPIGFCGITHVGNTVHVVGRYQGATDYYSSTDGGDTWQYHDLSALAQGLVDIVFTSPTTGFIGGMAASATPNQGPATILKTTDGGASWHAVFVHAGGRSWAWKIFPVTADLLYATLETVDGVYRVAKSLDGGEHWTEQVVATDQPTGTTGGLQGIGFLDANVGWVGGFFTGMYATTNGGENWHPVTLGSRNINRYRRVGGTLFTAGTQGVLRYDPRP